MRCTTRRAKAASRGLLDLVEVLDAADRQGQRAVAAGGARDLLPDALAQVGGVRQARLLVEVPELPGLGVEQGVGEGALEVGDEAGEELQVVVGEAAGGEAVGGHLVVEGERADHALRRA